GVRGTYKLSPERRAKGGLGCPVSHPEHGDTLSFAQLCDHDFLGRGEGRLQAVRRVRAIGNPVTALPAAN
ncbi:MAG: hypothetical protein, partial [Olavius algarvensis Gamma 1 endosymbiont]